MLDEPQFIKVITNDEKTYVVNKKMIAVSKLIEDNFENDPNQDIKLIEVSSSEFDVIQQYCELHNYKPQETYKRPIKSKDLRTNLGNDIDFELIGQKYDYITIKPLLDSAIYMIMPVLQQVCLTVIATYFFVQNTQVDLQEYMVLNDITEITMEEIEEMKILFPWAFDESMINKCQLYQEGIVFQQEEYKQE